MFFLLFFFFIHLFLFRIVTASARLLDDDKARRRMAAIPNPYGSGNAARRIIDDLTQWLMRAHEACEAGNA